jgi:hypothetical protein
MQACKLFAEAGLKLPISAFQVAKITGKSHQCTAKKNSELSVWDHEIDRVDTYILTQHSGLGPENWMELLGGTSRKDANLCDIIRVAGKRQGQVASYPSRNRLLCRLPGFCQSRMEAEVTEATGGMYWNILGPSKV